MKENPLTKRPHSVYKDVVVVGNGPSGLTMSFVLSGHMPVYNGLNHPDMLLNAAIRNLLSPNSGISNTNLTTLAQCLDGRSGASPNGLLMDSLIRPGADCGITSPSLINWAQAPPLSHVVIGKGPPGGTWRKMDGRTVTLSLSNWMELPGLPFHKSDAGRNVDVPPGGIRVPATTVGDYYQEYLHKMGLQKYQRRGVVTSVREYDESDDTSDSDKKINWVIDGIDPHGRSFRYVSKYVVLCCGANDNPNCLGVPGEQLPWVHHDLSRLDQHLKKYRPTLEDGPVLVIGSGLSACDGVLCTRSSGVPVVHVYRGTKGLTRWLPLTAYPEYQALHDLMTGMTSCPGYQGTGNLRLVGFSDTSNGQHLATLEDTTTKGRELIEISAAAVLIGSTADLSFLPRDNLGLMKGSVDAKNNPLEINPATYELCRLPNCFAIGPLAGDTFVRHILGGVVTVASQIRKIMQHSQST